MLQSLICFGELCSYPTRSCAYATAAALKSANAKLKLIAPEENVAQAALMACFLQRGAADLCRKLVQPGHMGFLYSSLNIVWDAKTITTKALTALILATSAVGDSVEMKTLSGHGTSLFESCTYDHEFLCTETMQIAVLLGVINYEAPKKLPWPDLVAPGGALYAPAVPAQAALLLFINAIATTFGIRKITEQDKW
jgi:hypothetical protein